MPDPGQGRQGFYGWLANFVERRSLWIIIGTLVITDLLLIPLFLMAPTEMASDNPTGNDVVKLNEKISEVFPSEIYFTVFIVESREGDVLTQECLYELYQNEQALRESNLSPFLFRYYNDLAGTSMDGIYTLADSVNTVLLLGSDGITDLSSANDLQVKQAVHHVLSNPLSQGMEYELSVKASYEETAEGIKYWKSPALTIYSQSDFDKIKKEYAASIGEDYTEKLAPEYYGREVKKILQGEQDSYRLWGVAIDTNLEVADESKVSTVMMGAAVILILVIMIVIFRSWIVVLVSETGLGMLIVWMKGFGNLVGLKSSMMIDVIIPVAIIVLGIDYAIHSLFRYREEVEKGNKPRPALGLSTYGVSSALVLAMLTTIIAFGSNASSGIESVVGFSISASFAIFASFIIMGLFVPTVIMRYDEWKGRRFTRSVDRDFPAQRGEFIGRFVAVTSKRWYIMLPAVLIISGISVIGWLNLETKMDIDEILDPTSDFMIGMDLMDEHIAEKAGEMAYLYIEGDFTEHEALDALNRLILEMEDDQHVARRLSDGKPNTFTYLFTFLADVVSNEYARDSIEKDSGVAITDTNGDLIPDTREQLQAVYEYITEKGIYKDEYAVLYTPERVREAFIHGETEKGEDATIVIIGVPGTREQAIIEQSANELQGDMDTAFTGVSSISFYGLTGEAYVRDAQFKAIESSMNRSLVIAIAACLILLLLIFRSPRYAILTLIPVLLVACCLYGFMYVVGLNLNMLTATIAAIAIGVGIDFSIHFTERFRQEKKRNPDKKVTLIVTSRSTGMALFGTAISTALGFAVIAFAPMPIISTFGILTAVMIALSFLMTLFVLPSLLLLCTPTGEK